jgi:death-on-curing protein
MPELKKQSCIFLTVAQLELIYAGVLAKSGGLYGTRNPGVLAALETKPRQKVFGKVLCRTLYEQAAVYAETIISQYPFVDGNKRTGIMAAFTFLEVNGRRVIASDNEVFDYALEIATDRLSIKHIAHWLRQHTKEE